MNASAARELGEVCRLAGFTSFIRRKRMRNRLNEPGEDFIGTRVHPNATRDDPSLVRRLERPFEQRELHIS